MSFNSTDTFRNNIRRDPSLPGKQNAALFRKRNSFQCNELNNFLIKTFIFLRPQVNDWVNDCMKQVIINKRNLSFVRKIGASQLFTSMWRNTS